MYTCNLLQRTLYSYRFPTRYMGTTRPPRVRSRAAGRSAAAQKSGAKVPNPSTIHGQSAAMAQVQHRPTKTIFGQLRLFRDRPGMFMRNTPSYTAPMRS